MKKLLLLFGVIILSQPVFAKTIPVQATAGFSTENPTENMTVIALDDLYLDKENILFHSGCTIYGKVVDVKSPKRLKRDAGFGIVVEKYQDKNGVLKEIPYECSAKFTTEIDKKLMAKKAALSVGNHFVEGLSMGYHAIEGAIKNENDNRLKSSVTSVYENSPLSLVKKGEDIYINKGDIFFLNFKVKEKDEPNYVYEVLD